MLHYDKNTYHLKRQWRRWYSSFKALENNGLSANDFNDQAPRERLFHKNFENEPKHAYRNFGVSATLPRPGSKKGIPQYLHENQFRFDS